MVQGKCYGHKMAARQGICTLKAIRLCALSYRFECSQSGSISPCLFSCLLQLLERDTMRGQLIQVQPQQPVRHIRPHQNEGRGIAGPMNADVVVGAQDATARSVVAITSTCNPPGHAWGLCHWSLVAWTSVGLKESTAALHSSTNVEQAHK